MAGKVHTAFSLQPGVLPPYVETVQEQVMDLMQTFEVNPFTDSEQTKIHFLEVIHWRKPSLLGAIFFAAIAAYTYYRTAHQYATFGLGALAVLTFYNSIEKIFKLSNEFKKFSDDCDLIAQHLTNAFVSKATFMLDQVNVENSKWNFSNDEQLGYRYEASLGRGIDTSKVKEGHSEWRKVHKTLSDTARGLGVAPLNDDHPRLKEVLSKVSRAKDLVLHGQSPAPKSSDDPKNKTYIQYLENGQAAFWPSAIKA